MKQAKKCLVTGGAGFIGFHLAQRLARMGCEVTILDLRNPDAKPPDGMVCLQGDVRDDALMSRLVPQHDTVFHLAALLGVKRTMTEPVSLIGNNVLGTMNVLKAAMKGRTKVVMASTSEVYGKGQPPFCEDGDLVFGSPAKLRWSYALAKAVEESLGLGYGNQGLDVTIVRYFNVYGPGQKEGPYGGVIPRFIRAALEGRPIPIYGDGSQTRSFTYVDDAVEMTVRAAFHPGTGREIFNIGSEQEVTVRDLAVMIKRLTRSSSPYEHIPFKQVYPHGFDEIPRRRPDMAKTKSRLGLESETALEQGLETTIRWFRKAMAEGGKRQ